MEARGDMFKWARPTQKLSLELKAGEEIIMNYRYDSLGPFEMPITRVFKASVPDSLKIDSRTGYDWNLRPCYKFTTEQ